MKICVLATSYPRHSGDHASVFVHTFCKGLVERGLEIKAIVPHEKGLSTEDSFDGVTLRRFRYLWPSHLEQVAYGYGIPENLRYKFWAKIGLPFFVLGFLIKAWRETLNCDLIHAHWEISALVGILISRKRKIPLVLTVHRLVAQNKLMKWLTKFIFTRMDMFHLQ